MSLIIAVLHVDFVELHSIKLSVNRGTHLYCNLYPTQNCQVFSIAPLSALIELSKSDVTVFTENLRQIISTVRTEYRKKQPYGIILNQLLFDVKTEYYKKFILQLDGVVFCTDYISTNESQMSIGLIDVRLLNT